MAFAVSTLRAACRLLLAAGVPLMSPAFLYQEGRSLHDTEKEMQSVRLDSVYTTAEIGKRKPNKVC